LDRIYLVQRNHVIELRDLIDPAAQAHNRFIELRVIRSIRLYPFQHGAQRGAETDDLSPHLIFPLIDVHPLSIPFLWARDAVPIDGQVAQLHDFIQLRSCLIQFYRLGHKTRQIAFHRPYQVSHGLALFVTRTHYFPLLF
jgi:hypothetical protein